ncbi:MAG: hypothetical protein WC516_05615 [Patescibacteria group bacterium]|jgi:hypothetical protein
MKKKYKRPEAICYLCSEYSEVYRRDGEDRKPVCQKCYRKEHTQQKEMCFECEKIKKICIRNDKNQPICANCYTIKNKKVCFICNKLERVCIRDEMGNPICKSCRRKNIKGVCKICGKFRWLELFEEKICHNCYANYRYKTDGFFPSQV